MLVFILSFKGGKYNLLIAPFVELVHCSCHVILFSFPSVIIVSLGILSYTISPMSSHRERERERDIQKPQQ
jgi:hypothetical protein